MNEDPDPHRWFQQAEWKDELADLAKAMNAKAERLERSAARWNRIAMFTTGAVVGLIYWLFG
jgi:hypothetical protein